MAVVYTSDTLCPLFSLPKESKMKVYEYKEIHCGKISI